MLRSWKSLHSLLNTLNKAAADVRSFGVLLFLFVFIYALVGMQLFANRLHFDPMTGIHIAIEHPRYASSTIPRHNFDELSTAVTTVFQVLSGENWNEVMYDCWKATAWISPLYFLSLVVLGVFIVLNMFLAILLKQFDDNDDEDEQRHLPETETEEEPPNRSPLSTKLRSQVRVWFRSTTSGHGCMTERCYWCRKARDRCNNLVKDKRFENALTVAILLSSMTLALDNPLADPSTPLAAMLETSNYIFTVIFMSEFVIKIFAHGPVVYFSDEWNLLDFSALFASVLEVLNLGRGKSLRTLRTLRVLRPLKTIRRFPEIKLVVDALLSSLPSVLNVGTICGVLYLTFAIFGVTFLKGTFYQCSEVEITSDQLELITNPVPLRDFADNQLAWLQPDVRECSLKTWSAEYAPTSRELCNCMGSVWEPVIPQNFDNVLRGFSLLLEISTTESWVDVMVSLYDSYATTF
jgi:voltage-dependent calcium channel L type alpha-1D